MRENHPEYYEMLGKNFSVYADEVNAQQPSTDTFSYIEDKSKGIDLVTELFINIDYPREINLQAVQTKLNELQELIKNLTTMKD
jgi:hypothetical protein